MARLKQTIKKICEHCGKEFEAGKTTTRCCSAYCSKKAYKEAKRKEIANLVESSTVQKKSEKTKADLSYRPYLSMTEAATLAGVSRWTIYRYVVSGILPCAQITKRTVRIKRIDLDLFFDNAESYIVNRNTQEKHQPITEWYTINDITAKYGVKYRRLRDIFISEKIPTKKAGKFILAAKRQVDTYFKQQGYDETLNNFSEWVTVQDIKEMYNYTESTAYSFVSMYNIPRKQQGGVRYYSKYHIDNVKYNMK
jgi:excisionase family DNA binding protein